MSNKHRGKVLGDAITQTLPLPAAVSSFSTFTAAARCDAAAGHGAVSEHGSAARPVMASGQDAASAPCAERLFRKSMASEVMRRGGWLASRW